MVSVIVPVYNVEKYLNKCLETVVNQTYKDVEIILINDGSTDNSGKICELWASSDKRIKYIEKENEGLGPTRNLGIRIARGEYVLFIDSDDWWEYDAIEKLYELATTHDADIVYMNFYFSEYDKEGNLIERPHIRHFTINGAVDAKSFPKIIFDEDARMWSKMFRRALFIDNNIFMPAHSYEDLPVMPLLSIYANKVCQSNEVLYHYYYQRPNNIIGNSVNKKYIFTGIRELYNEFEKRGLMETYKKPLMEYIIGMAKFALNEMQGDRQEYIDIIKEMYPNYPYNLDLKFVIWGSYNSLIIARNVTFINTQILDHYMFSSVISAMSEREKNTNPVTHENAFRKDMINKDVQKLLLSQREGKLSKADYIFVDFLEEINDVIKSNNTFYTHSEAHKEAGIFNSRKFRTLSITDKERTVIWESRCLDFIERIRQLFRPDQVILLKQKLCKKYGTRSNELKLFSNIKEIEEINDILSYYYLYFERNFPGIKTIDTEIEDATYTYEFSKYGCLPQYYNGIQYKKISEKILAEISKV
jgi:glycosyltransferase involved in cell wall biosynthesis